MRTARVLGSGDLQLLILLLLSEKPRHGYEIIKAIEEHSSGVYTPSPGMVYPRSHLPGGDGLRHRHG